jgi:hypothetical protein
MLPLAFADVKKWGLAWGILAESLEAIWSSDRPTLCVGLRRVASGPTIHTTEVEGALTDCLLHAAALARDLERCAAIQAVMARELSVVATW